eukprot:Skav201563  [mRNA]  locus=scaffold152:30971:31453:+ [translate_table: standard]
MLHSGYRRGATEHHRATGVLEDLSGQTQVRRRPRDCWAQCYVLRLGGACFSSRVNHFEESPYSMEGLWRNEHDAAGQGELDQCSCDRGPWTLASVQSMPPFKAMPPTYFQEKGPTFQQISRSLARKMPQKGDEDISTQGLNFKLKAKPKTKVAAGASVDA